MRLARGVRRRLPRIVPWPMVLQVLGVAAAVWLVVSTWKIWMLVFIALIFGYSVYMNKIDREFGVDEQ